MFTSADNTALQASAVRRAHPEDLVAVSELLRAAGLPTEDLASASNLQCWVLEDGGQLIGTIGLECFGRAGLVRSLVVDAAHRGRGVGRELLAQLERQALAQGVEQLVLLTQTAAPFFQQLHYRLVERSEVPEELQQSQQFVALCPASALCLTRSLQPATR